MYLRGYKKKKNALVGLRNKMVRRFYTLVLYYLCRKKQNIIYFVPFRRKTENILRQKHDKTVDFFFFLQSALNLDFWETHVQRLLSPSTNLFPFE